jgi:8-oxo-dGTP pyrophosphatase MutT (NUDIX family)
VRLLERVLACRRHDLTGFLPFEVDGVRYGWTAPDVADLLVRQRGAFVRSPRGLTLRPDLTEPSARTAQVERDLRSLERAGLVHGWRGERYPVVNGWGEREAFQVERAAAPRLGTKAFGVHVNAWVRGREGPLLWVAQRSQDRAHAPGKLDHLVAGGQPAGLTLAENLVKECAEEAGLPADLALRAVPAAPFGYLCTIPEGVRDDTLFVYDLEVPAAFEPRNVDGEVESFALRPAAWVRETLRTTDAFKFNVGPCILGWLLRQGVVGPDDPEHAALAAALTPWAPAPPAAATSATLRT